MVNFHVQIWLLSSYVRSLPRSIAILLESTSLARKRSNFAFAFGCKWIGNSARMFLLWSLTSCRPQMEILRNSPSHDLWNPRLGAGAWGFTFSGYLATSLVSACQALLSRKRCRYFLPTTRFQARFSSMLAMALHGLHFCSEYLHYQKHTETKHPGMRTVVQWKAWPVYHNRPYAW